MDTHKLHSIGLIDVNLENGIFIIIFIQMCLYNDSLKSSITEQNEAKKTSKNRQMYFFS